MRTAPDRSVFVGRTAELSALAGLATQVVSGQGGTAWIEGEPGIGKSALVRTCLADAHLPDRAILWGCASRLQRQFPLRVMLDCLASHALNPDLDMVRAVLRGNHAGLLAPAGNPVVAAAEVTCELIARLCEKSPIVFVIDDLHWADEMSVSVWHRLAGEAACLPLLVIGIVRSQPLPPWVADARRGVRAGHGLMLELGPLDSGEVPALVHALIGNPPGRRLLALADQAAGNPLYIRELTDALVREGRLSESAGSLEISAGGQPMPSLTAAIENRLDFMSEPALESLRVAALLGERFSVAELATVRRCRALDLMAALREGIATGVLADSGPQLAFRHALIRQALYQGMPASLRSALHSLAAQAFSEAGAPPVKVAEQLLAADSAAPGVMTDAWTVRWLADEALSLAHQVPQVATELLKAALEPMADSDSMRDQLESALLICLSLLAMHDEVVRLANRILARSPDSERIAEVTWLLCTTLCRQGRADDATAVMAAGALSLTGLSAVWQARICSLHALVLNFVGRRDESARVAADAATAGRQAGDSFAIGYALHVLSLVADHRRDQAAVLRYIDEALGIIGDSPHTTDLRIMMLANRMDALRYLDRQEEAETTIGAALRLAERVGTPRLTTIGGAAAEYYFLAGRWDDARAMLRSVEDLPGSPWVAVWLHGLQALIAGHRDEREAAGEHLRCVTGPAGDLISQRVLSYHLLLARALAAEQARDLAGAVTILAQCLQPGYADDMPEIFVLLPTLVRLATATGDARTIVATVSAARLEAERERLPLKSATAQWCGGIAEHDPGPILAAASYYRQAGRPLDLGAALEDAAVAVAESGNLAEARAMLRESVLSYSGLGAQWDIIRADARLRSYGVLRRRRGSARPATGWAALTPTETTVALLVAEGLSNPDIGARLFISWRTVRFHVSAIMKKLQVHSRFEVAREAARHRHAPDTLYADVGHSS